MANRFDPDIDMAAMADRASNDVERLFYSHTGNLVHKWHHYFEVYDRYLGRFRDRPIKLIEIGVSQGGSLQLWRNFFGPLARIVGVDIAPRCEILREQGLDVRIGGQTDAEFLHALIAEIGGIDVLIDDGSHMCAHQRATFEIVFPVLNDGGIYLCEDLHTSYQGRFGGGHLREGTMIEYAKTLVDRMHAWYAAESPALKECNITRSLHSVSFFDSIALFEKRPISTPFRVQAGNRLF